MPLTSSYTIFLLGTKQQGTIKYIIGATLQYNTCFHTTIQYNICITIYCIRYNGIQVAGGQP